MPCVESYHGARHLGKEVPESPTLPYRVLTGLAVSAELVHPEPSFAFAAGHVASGTRELASLWHLAT